MLHSIRSYIIMLFCISMHFVHSFYSLTQAQVRGERCVWDEEEKPCRGRAWFSTVKLMSYMHEHTYPSGLSVGWPDQSQWRRHTCLVLGARWLVTSWRDTEVGLVGVHVNQALYKLRLFALRACPGNITTTPGSLNNGHHLYLWCLPFCLPLTSTD